jgi:cytochrome b pre-mRNA-processing protein 3
VDGDGVTRGYEFDKLGREKAVIFSLFRKDPRRIAIAALYARIATASRAPGLYAALSIPDTLEGRFESLSLHMVLSLRALRNLPAPADDVAKDLTDAFFQDMDASLREMGVGDTVVPKRMKKVATAFFGRAQAYDPALNAGDEAALAEALGRNALGGEAPAVSLARYALAADRALEGTDLDALLESGPVFPAPEAFKEEDNR